MLTAQNKKYIIKTTKEKETRSAPSKDIPVGLGKSDNKNNKQQHRQNMRPEEQHIYNNIQTTKKREHVKPCTTNIYTKYINYWTIQSEHTDTFQYGILEINVPVIKLKQPQNEKTIIAQQKLINYWMFDLSPQTIYVIPTPEPVYEIYK